MSDREEFETWAAFDLMQHDFERGVHGEYLDDFLQHSWLGWKAAHVQGGAESIENRSEIYRMQAEAIISATNKCQIKSATDDSKCYSAALLDYAKQLNWWADKLESDK